MGLRIPDHLQPMLHFAVRAVMRNQRFGHLTRNPAGCRQRAQSTHRGRIAQSHIAPACDQLAGLGEKFDLSDAADPKFQIVALHSDRPMQAAMIADPQAHVMRILNRGKVEMFAPDERRQRGQKPRSGRDVSGTRAGLDIGGALPGAALRLVVPRRHRHRQADRHHGGIRAQPQIAAKHIALIGLVRQKRRHLARDANEGGAGIGFHAGIAGLVEQADKVDV